MNTPMKALLDGLNEAQKAAVTSPASCVQVIAPPGSGKTKTLTARVAYHINHERLQPWNIIVCTFTIKAAREMRERIRGFVGEGIERKLILGTFHSVCRRFLYRYGHEINLPKNFGIADSNESRSILKRIIQRQKYTVDPKQASTRISGLKSKGISEEQFAATQKKADQHEFACVYTEYQEYLKAQKLLDFDDLLVRTVELLRKHPACVSTIQAVLIDEYQDTNNIQYELMKLMSQSKGRVTVVGDPDQSIYSFRSAEIKNFSRMRDELPSTIAIHLENNYRSSGCITTAAKAVIERDDTRPIRPMVSTHCPGTLPTLRHLATAALEAKWIVEEINRTKTLAAGLLNHNDYSILLRATNLSLSIEKALSQAGIPYRMVGGRRFFDRAEIKLLLDYLRVINQPDHNEALARVINLPSRRIGETTIKALLDEADRKKVSLWELVLNCAQGKRPDSKISAPAQNGIDTFVNLIITARGKLLAHDGKECSIVDLISYVLQKVSFEAYLKSAYKESWSERWANVEELVIQATQLACTLADADDDKLPVVEGIEQREDTAADILSKFLVNVALSTEVERDDGEEICQVTISTVHAAKGLEWPVTFIPAVYDGSIPHSRAEDHNEERRLLYVGMTRPKALLYLSCPVNGSNLEDKVLSKFISDRQIQKLFTLNGPTIGSPTDGCTVLKGIAQILGRECPSPAAIQAARETLEYPEDVQYPLTREEISGGDPPWGDSKISNEQDELYFKRRKLERSSSSTNGTVSVTMQQSKNFSISKTTLQSTHTGFKSAKDIRDIQRLQEEAEAIRMLATAREATASKNTYKETRTSGRKVPQPMKGKPRAAGQGAITSFFSRTKPTVATETEDLPAKAPLLKRSCSSLIDTSPLSDISNLPPQPLPIARPYQVPTLSGYKVQTARMVTKPKRVEPEQYVDLSSSPPRSESSLAHQHLLVDSNDAELSTEPRNSVPSTSTTVPRAATTFHTTSMEQLQNQPAAPQRRTLGARRSMQGWSVKHTALPRPRSE